MSSCGTVVKNQINTTHTITPVQIRSERHLLFPSTTISSANVFSFFCCSQAHCFGCASSAKRSFNFVQFIQNHTHTQWLKNSGTFLSFYFLVRKHRTPSNGSYAACSVFCVCVLFDEWKATTIKMLENVRTLTEKCQEREEKKSYTNVQETNM